MGARAFFEVYAVWPQICICAGEKFMLQMARGEKSHFWPICEGVLGITYIWS